MTLSAMDTAKLPRSGIRASGVQAPATSDQGDGAALAPSAESLRRSAGAALEAGAELAGRGDVRADGEISLASLATLVPPPAAAGRRARREERRQLRRKQRRYAALGIVVLAAVFLAAVIVLGGIR